MCILRQDWYLKRNIVFLIPLQFPLPLERYLSPPEDNLNLLNQYFHVLVTGALQQHWCPVLYVVAVAHVNTFIFSQENVPQVCNFSQVG